METPPQLLSARLAADSWGPDARLVRAGGLVYGDEPLSKPGWTRAVKSASSR